jgi:putative nucleotidyltransferase with HDIG domain
VQRQDALALLHEYTKTDSLRKHALAVEAALRAYAAKRGEDVELWGMTGLLHDFDYEMFPAYPDHPTKGSAILEEKGYPLVMRTAILGHVPATNVARDTDLARVLFACDELCGFIVACAMVRPNKLADLGASSVKKKLKDKAFARAVSREEIAKGVEELGVNMDEHIAVVVAALQSIAGDLGLA